MLQHPAPLCSLRRRLRAAAWAALCVALLGVGVQAAAAAHGHAPDQHPEHLPCITCLALHGIDAALPGSILAPHLPAARCAAPVTLLLSVSVSPAATSPDARAPPHLTC